MTAAADLVPDPAALAAAVTGCLLVARLDGGRFGETTSYLPGQRIPGVTVRPDRISIAVVGTAAATAAILAAQVKAAAFPFAAGLTIDVVFADIEVDTGTPP